MNAGTKTKKQLEAELTELHRQIDELHKAQAEYQKNLEDLRASEERYRTVLDTIADGYYEVDLSGTFTFINDSMARIFGYTPDEMVGVNYIRLTDEKDAETLYKSFNQVFRTGKAIERFEWRLKRKDGAECHVEASVSLNRDENGLPEGFRGIARDVSNRLQAQDNLRKSEEKYRTILDTIEDGYYEVDLAGNFTFFNSAMCVILGYSPEEMMGLNYRKYMREEEAGATFEIFNNVFLTGTPARAYDWKIIRQNGSEGFAEASISLMRDSDGAPVGFRGIARDVSDRLRDQEALRESEERYRTILDTIEDGYYELDLAGSFTFFNKAMCEILGYPPEEMMGLNDQDYMDAEQAKAAFKTYNAVYRTGRPTRAFNWRLIKKDGSICFIEASVSLIRDRDGNPIGFRGISRDITPRIRAEEALRESEERYRSILDNIEEGYWEIDLAGNSLFFNDALGRIFDLEPDAMVGVNYREYMSEEDRKVAFQTYNQVFQTGQSVSAFSWKLTRQDGSEHFLETSVSLIRDPKGEPIGFKGLTRDITEHKKAQEAIRESEEKYRLLAENVTDIIWTTDADFNYTYVSPSITNLLGYTPEESVGLPLYTAVPRDFRSRVDRELAPLRTMLDRNGRVDRDAYAVTPFEIQNYRKDSSRIWVEVKSGALHDEAGQFLGLIGVTRDISERKRAEAERMRLEDQLQRAQKMEAIGTLAGGVAHDLNNILSGIVSYPELILMDLPPDSPLRQPILTMQDSGLKAAAIVQDMLTLARRGVAVSEIVNLNDIISDYLKSLECKKMRSYHPDVSMKTVLDPNLFNISGSSVHLSKTVMNLISNAAEAITDRGEIIISTVNQYVDKPIHGYDTVEEGDYVTITIEDTGVGIAPGDVERIFEPFYTKKVMGRSGTGLGMAVVWGSVKDHKGYIDLRSTPGKGSCFTLYFPITREELTEQKQRLTLDDYKGHGESILLVDDVREQREIATKLLEKLEYRVTAVASGEQAVEYLRQHSADLLVLDMIMDPGIDGLETYRQIVELHPGQKAIIASGFSETDRVREAQKLGAGQYIKKPYALEKIGLAVRTELDKRPLSESE